MHGGLLFKSAMIGASGKGVVCMIEEELGDKKRYIVTFEKKYKRKEKKADKTEILQQSVGPKLELIDTGIAPSDLSEHYLYCS
jgi:hypothetical protein